MSSAPMFFEECRALPLVSLTLALPVGAALDPPGKDGLTRVTARMLRRGCRGMTSAEVEARIDALGAEVSVDVSQSSVSINFDVIERSLDDLVDLLVRMLAEPTFDERELGRLLRESEGELIEARDNDRSLAVRHFRRAFFEGHPYGRRTAGQLATLRTISRDDVVAHFPRMLARHGAHVAIAGSVSEARARALADRLVEALPDGGGPAPAIVAPSPRPGRRLVFVDKPERTQTQIIIGARGVHPREPSFWPLVLGTTVFGGTFTSRLMREVRSKRGWSYGASARVGYDRQPDALTVWTFPAAKDAAACIALELGLLDTWRDKGVTARELAFVRRYLVRSHAFEIDTAHKRVGLPLEVALLDLPPTHHSAFVEHVRGVTLESVQAAVAAHAPHRDLLIAVVGTHVDIGSAVRDAIPNLADASVVPFDSE